MFLTDYSREKVFFTLARGERLLSIEKGGAKEDTQWMKGNLFFLHMELDTKMRTEQPGRVFTNAFKECGLQY